MISGHLLYIPLSVYGFTPFLLTEQASLGTALVATLIGLSYHLSRMRFIGGEREQPQPSNILPIPCVKNYKTT
jgi:hypothetical protein